MNLQPATYKLLYNNRNITTDIADHLISLTYTDKVAGEADELELVLEDADALWQNEWYPEKGAVLSAQIISNDRILNCGSFSIDEPTFSFGAGGDTISIRAVSAAFTKQLRTKRTTAHENKTFDEIARSVASRHGLTIQGTIPSITLGRMTQHKKNDLQFLQGIAITYGYAFSIKGTTMVFTDITTLEKSGSVLTIDKADVIEGSITDKSSETYKKANVKFHNPVDKTLVESSSTAGADIAATDTLEIRQKAENKQQAERMALGMLHHKNSYAQSGNLSLPGNCLLIAGVNFELMGVGNVSGLYNITQSTHSLSRDSAYTTSVEIKKVAAIAASKHISKAKKATPVTITPTQTIKKSNRDGVDFTFIQ